jgi:hypothetical protein
VVIRIAQIYVNIQLFHQKYRETSKPVQVRFSWRIYIAPGARSETAPEIQIGFYQHSSTIRHFDFSGRLI